MINGKKDTQCVWDQEDVDDNVFETDCKNNFYFTCETENYLEKKFKFCPFCGKEIKAI